MNDSLHDRLVCSREARRRLGLTRGQLDYRVHRARTLRPDGRVGKLLGFLPETLSRYRLRHGRNGRSRRRPRSFRRGEITVREAARRLGTTPDEVGAMIRRGEVRVAAKRAGMRAIREEELP